MCNKNNKVKKNQFIVINVGRLVEEGSWGGLGVGEAAYSLERGGG